MLDMTGTNSGNITELLSGSGYSDRAIAYFLEKENMGSLPDADQMCELTGPCGDKMKIYLKLDEQERIADAKIQVLGCLGAIASAMAVRTTPQREGGREKARRMMKGGPKCQR